MTDKEILENNIVLAEFMGYEMDEDGYYLLPGNLPQFRRSDHAEWCSTKTIDINWNDPKSVELYKDTDGYYWQISPDGLAYKGSWEWLMTVVDKIDELKYFNLIATRPFGEGFYMNIVTGIGIADSTLDNPSKLMRVSSTSRKECVYNTVVEFVKWYNINKK